MLGGSVGGTIVNSGAYDVVYSGGQASGTVVNAGGGGELVSSGGTAIGATVSSGSYEDRLQRRPGERHSGLVRRL